MKGRCSFMYFWLLCLTSGIGAQIYMHQFCRPCSYTSSLALYAGYFTLMVVLYAILLLVSIAMCFSCMHQGCMPSQHSLMPTSAQKHGNPLYRLPHAATRLFLTIAESA